MKLYVVVVYEYFPDNNQSEEIKSIFCLLSAQTGGGSAAAREARRSDSATHMLPVYDETSQIDRSLDRPVYVSSIDYCSMIAGGRRRRRLECCCGHYSSIDYGRS